MTAKKSTMVEYIPEGEYLSTEYDNLEGNLQEIDEHGGANPDLNENYKDRYDRDYDSRNETETETNSYKATER